MLPVLCNNLEQSREYRGEKLDVVTNNRGGRDKRFQNITSANKNTRKNAEE